MYSTNTRVEFLSLYMEFVEMRYVLVFALEVDAAVKSLLLLWTKVHFVLHLGACTHALSQIHLEDSYILFVRVSFKFFGMGPFCIDLSQNFMKRYFKKLNCFPYINLPAATLVLSHTSIDIIC